MITTYSCWESEESTATSTRDQIVYTAIVTLLKLPCPISDVVYSSLPRLLTYPHQWVRLAASQLLGHLLGKIEAKSMHEKIGNGKCEGYLASYEKIFELVKGSLEQMRSANILPEHANQLVRNFVWFTSTLIYLDSSAGKVEDELSAEDLIHKLTALASVESSQEPNNITKRGVVLKWVGAVVNALEPSLLKPFLPSLVAPVHREIKLTDGPAEELAGEVMDFLRKQLGTEVLSQAVVTAEKYRSEKRRKRKRESALAAIADPASHAKKKVKSNLAKRDKRKEKYKKLKAKQYIAH